MPGNSKMLCCFQVPFVYSSISRPHTAGQEHLNYKNFFKLSQNKKSCGILK